nr:MAG TPA: Organic solute transporter subunit beta protein [Caudoviricetes sp.]
MLISFCSIRELRYKVEEASTFKFTLFVLSPV